ncbi:hypothetical protein CC80DRAFT_597854 [Byssothecium circinans]|uniref:Uncharacterized protein n=1 Tax=Byssothecium circinans TaxID=147558 RepID=A0A6A5TPB0_9PLEO|nr:hypothetical protein CC80DRAFT_597854 [Byssothecium circinans]
MVKTTPKACLQEESGLWVYWLFEAIVPPRLSANNFFSLFTNSGHVPPPNIANISRSDIDHIVYVADIVYLHPPISRRFQDLPGTQNVRAAAGEGGAGYKVEPRSEPLPIGQLNSPYTRNLAKAFTDKVSSLPKGFHQELFGPNSWFYDYVRGTVTLDDLTTNVRNLKILAKIYEITEENEDPAQLTARETLV